MSHFSSTDDALRWWAASEPTKPFIVFQGERVTYGEVDTWVDRVASHLSGLGINAGDRVGVLGGNSVEWCVASLAALRVGAVHAALSERAVPGEVRAMTQKTGTRHVVVAESHAAVLQAAVQQGEISLIPMARITGMRQGEAARFERPDIPEDEVAIIVYTSGSTGMPKGAAFTMRSLLSVSMELALFDTANGHEARALGVLPLSPMGGFVNSVLRISVVGGTTYLQAKFDEHEALRLLQQERCSSLMATPLIFQRISALPAFAKADLSSLTYAIIGGAPVPLDEFDKWVARGASLRQTYGSTESGGHFSVMPIAGARENPAGWGRGNLFRKVKAVRSDGSECSVGESGEILVRGPGLMEGYWDDPEATAAALRDGWLHTGDLGCQDHGGIWRITDRIKHVIITGGYNVGPAEVERALIELSGVKCAAVMAVPDPVYQEAVGAIVHAEPGVTAAHIVAHCRGTLSDYKVPRYVLVLHEDLPRTEQGKLDKVTMKARYGDMLAKSPRPQ